jgi:Fe-S-cluster containining protein
MIRPIADFITEQQLGPWIGEPLPDRQCGGCTRCCTALGIDSPGLRKDRGVPCRHLAAGGGCGIYGDRPAVCREYLCLWRVAEELPEEARPDRCGVLFAYGRNRAHEALCAYAIVASATRGPDDFDHPTARAALDTLIAAEAMPVYLEYGGRWVMVFPDAALADAMLHPEATADPYLRDRAAALRRNWDISAAAREARP